MTSISELARNIDKIHNIQWSYNNNFRVQISYDKTDSYGVIPEAAFFKSEDFDLHVIGVTTPQLNVSPIEVFQAGEWYYSQGRHEIYKFNMKIRDKDNNSLFKIFSKMYFMQAQSYAEDIYLNIIIFKGSDNADTSNMNQYVKLMELKDVLIESVSNLDFSNDAETQIQEFSVEFKTGVKPI